MSTRTPSEPGSHPGGDWIPLSVPHLGGNEGRYIQECLDTNWVSSVGPFVDRFEQCLAERVGATRAVATCNGTAALHVALLVAGVEVEDEVLVSDLTFIAPANAVRYIGAWPVFIDAEPRSWQMDPGRIADFLDGACDYQDGVLRNKATSRRVRAILPVHVLGNCVDMDPILEIARKYGLVVVEDATENLGATYKGRPAGRLGDIACFSFNGNKIITTGGGGMIVTDNPNWAERARYLTTQAKDDPVEYIHKNIGFNYRLTNIQAAMGCAQMERLKEHVDVKRRIAHRYETAFQSIRGITPMRVAEDVFCTYWMYTVLIDAEVCGIDSREALRRLKEHKIQTRPLWQPLHLSPAHAESPSTPCAVAERLYRDGLSLPCSVGLTEADQDRVIDAVAALAS
ncbi:MAG: LegC family aminotransferase [Kiritimatiellae bacterium]|nr:LegC family aminotransferase [Kiritimatiellia bacterium]